MATTIFYIILFVYIVLESIPATRHWVADHPWKFILYILGGLLLMAVYKWIIRPIYRTQTLLPGYSGHCPNCRAYITSVNYNPWEDAYVCRCGARVRAFHGPAPYKKKDS